MVRLLSESEERNVRARRARVREEGELVRARELPDRRLALLGVRASRGLLDVAEDERRAPARVASALPAGVRLDPLLHVVRDAHVEAPVRALEDVDEPGQRLLRSTEGWIVGASR